MQLGSETSKPADHSSPTTSRGTWHELELGLLALLVFGIYFTRLTDLPIRGEESRWAQVAYEMLQSGDYIVPRQQGEPFPDRPPLNSWAMVLASFVLGDWNLAAVRLPTVLATLATTLLIYVYSRNFLSRIGALTAGAAYATMGQVLGLGRVAESDAILTLCVSSSLLVWHMGYMRRWPAAWTWVAGYALAALAGLAKGPQGPLYFVGAATVFLLLNRDWRYLFNWRQLVGIGVFALVLGAWQVPFFMALDSESVKAVWSEGSTFGGRFNYGSVSAAAIHLLKYPLDVYVSMLPWSTLLICFGSRRFRASMGEARPYVLFLVTACLVAFPTCWLPAESRPRYFMSLYPCVAPLIGLAVQRALESNVPSWWQKSWNRYLAGMSLTMLVAAVVVLGASSIPKFQTTLAAQSPWFALIYGIVSIRLAWAAFTARRGCDLQHARLGVLSVAAFVGLTFTGLVLNAMIRSGTDIAGDVQRVRELLPADEPLVSFGQVHHVFAYYFREPISVRTWPKDETLTDPGVKYFCFSQNRRQQIKVPFPWEQVAVVSCDRVYHQDPIDKVIIGRRLDPTAGRAKPAATRAQ
jgi:4-amino-4-deoxy-L-arabinose transferase-like glycosyltransferase